MDALKRDCRIFTTSSVEHPDLSRQRRGEDGGELLHVENSDFIGDNIQSILLKDKPLTSFDKRDETIWIGTVAGLVSYDKQNNQWRSYKSYPTTEVLREDNISWIQQDGPNLWALNCQNLPMAQ
jgi:hypothetical protein